MNVRWKPILLVLFLVFFLVVIPLMAFFGLFTGDMRIEKGKKVVVIDVRGSMREYQPQFSAGIVLARGEITQTDILTAIERAAGDRRVEALIMRVFPSAAGAAKCEEIHDALHRFRETGKRVITFSPVLVNYHYLIACASDSVFMPPSGFLLVSGPASSAVFIRGMFDKLGITPNIHRIERYKSAAEMLTNYERSPESQEMTENLLNDFFDRFVKAAADDRGVREDTVRAWVDRALFNPQRAVEEGIIDGVRYWDQITAMFRTEGIDLIELHKYSKDAGSYSPGAPRVAVIHAQGRIVMGESGIDPVEGLTMGSETITRELRKARDSRRIEAILLRVDSHGGDGLAGEVISREVEITARTKPVVVSMSDVAASGGYEISYRADRIVALPGSITGSIGSIIGKLNMHGLYDRIGVTKDETGIGDKSLIQSDYRDYSAAEWDVIVEEHWAFYRNWITDIARCRGMTVGAVDSVGRGRVWTGGQARERGLIDDVGGFDRALEAACELAGIDDPSRVDLVHLPERMSMLEVLFSGRLFEEWIVYTLHGIIDRAVSDRESVLFDRELPGRMRVR